jgi:hypothetical protein
MSANAKSFGGSNGLILRLIAGLMLVITSTSVHAQSPPPGRAGSESLLDAAGRLYDLDPVLLRSIAAVESDNDPRAISPKGAQGLMQLMPATAQRFSVENPMDPADNVLGAVRFITFLQQWQALHPEVGGGMAQLLAAYNAGEGAVAKYHGVPPYPETREYVRLVLTAYLFGGKLPPEFRVHRAASANRGKNLASAHRRVVTKAILPAADPMRQLAEIQRARTEAEKRMAGAESGE